MSDEFDAYDFSEFTPEDLAAIDADLARAHPGPTIQIAIEQSPFHKFLSWKKHLAVTDLVSPIWCEVQHEYSLYGKRYKPLQLRPSAFTSKNGKQIRVHQQVARANDRRLKRGKSVHKALEDELRPEKIIVRVVSEEERFGLRLVQLIDGFNQLVTDGITRELPVFAITHTQVVLGVIDEVLRSPLTQGSQDHVISPRSPPTSSSGSPPKKKQRLRQIASFVPDLPTRAPATNTDCAAESTSNTSHATRIPGDPYELRIVDYKTRRSSNTPLDEDSLSPRLQLMMYYRMLSSLLEPEAFDFDLLWSRLNLNSTKPFSSQFLEDIVWEQRRVDSADRNVHLNRLVSEWISTVQRKRPGLAGVSQQLQIVYRRSVFAGKQREKEMHKATEAVDVDDPLQALVLQEELDLARAIEESLSKMGHEEADQVARHVAQNVKQAGPSSVGRSSAVWKDLISPLDSGQTDPALAWAIQQSLLNCAHEACVQMPANKSYEADTKHGDHPSDEIKPTVNETTVDISPIIGVKEFRMNDDELDTHLSDVLQWWFGARPSRGVDVSQTNRCFTCEYQDSCEWREQKAREAVALTAERRATDQQY
ncbi:exonuclease V a 5' deoxyribonuclease-domain-containing protein [Lanmaoa asiatica]|nr:exonuclease V a 5' deoxyribonuclease-domain-containing protein [Lanmaoa asiatica]